jgi:hypothetical protein
VCAFLQACKSVYLEFWTTLSTKLTPVTKASPEVFWTVRNDKPHDSDNDKNIICEQRASDKQTCKCGANKKPTQT